ncbi:hypothetical protein J2X63_001766 [Agromyces sp. 3263]|uniref:T-complex 10 C-terminal domain-containing protein n=1 Tax=Agromyces sp. 3263 TaxID=2817750 RepID=UPI00285AF76A|nr:T-complex 10 C-terminal domain-containing protein [Agromyces sp. 3263]MDR6906080.1 hypothetical protein [Agromyces sp. 3263]
MVLQRVGMSVAAAAVVLIGVVGCSVAPQQEDAKTTTPNQAAPDRNLTLDVGTVIYPDGTVEYVGRNVTLGVGAVIHPDGTPDYRGNQPIDASTLLEASTGQ